MKKLGIFNKLVFFINSLFAFFLLVGYLLPFFPPKIFSPISVLTLVIPVLLLVNVLFVIYWLLLFKRQFLVSSIVVVIWFFHGTTLYKLDSGTRPEAVAHSEKQLNILSYNVHVFQNEKYSKQEIQEGFTKLIDETEADILCFQEFSNKQKSVFKDYAYSYQGKNGNKNNHGQAIFSNYKILNSGSFDFESSFNNGIYVDILKEKDTIRIYNLHMQSLALMPQLEALEQERTKSLVGRLGRAFAKQQEQTELFLENQKQCPYKTIVTGDFNNTVFSYTYTKIRGDRKDAFEEEGTGFGKTYVFDFIPMRIDFILPDSEFKVLAFKNFEVDYSDHFPIQAIVEL